MDSVTAAAEAPRATEIPKELTYHGDTRVDPFYWLRERTNPEVKAYLEKENDFCTKVVEQQAPGLDKKLFEEMKARWKETDTSLPTKDRDFWYFSRTIQGLDYPQYCRKPYGASPNFVREFAELLLRDENAILPFSDDEVCWLDLNKVATEEKLEYVSLGTFEVSPDQRRIAFSLDTTGSESYNLVIKDVEAGKEVSRILSAPGHQLSSSVGWGDNHTLFYVLRDEAHKPYKAVRHDLEQHKTAASGTADANKDASLDVVFEEPVESSFGCWGAGLTEDRKFVVLVLTASTSREYLILPASDAAHGQFKVFYPRTPKFEYDITHHEDLLGPGKGGWLVRHNGDGCTNFRVDYVADGEDTTNRANWHPLIAYDAPTQLTRVSCFKTHMLIGARRDGFPAVALLSLEEVHAAVASKATVPASALVNVSSLIACDEPELRAINCTAIVSSDDYTAVDFRVRVTNLVVPSRTFEVNAADKTVFQLKKELVRGYDPSLYGVARIFATATLSTCDARDPELSLSALASDPKAPILIPITLCYRKNLLKRGENPLLLYSYGSYGSSSDPEFAGSRVSLLDRGVIYAVASIRGGGELGRIWRNSGRMEHKMNTFTDFVACAEHVIAEKWSHPKKLMARGGSAGGMLMGVVTNLRPDLFCSVASLVPFVDCLTTMLDPTIPLTVGEWQEWGNPLHDEKFYHVIKAYSPMDNLPGDVKTVFPNLFIKSGFTDPRVAYWEPAAYVARLRPRWDASAAAGRILVHKCNMGAGHGGASGRYKALEELAFEFAFMLSTVGIKE